MNYFNKESSDDEFKKEWDSMSDGEKEGTLRHRQAQLRKEIDQLKLAKHLEDRRRDNRHPSK